MSCTLKNCNLLDFQPLFQPLLLQLLLSPDFSSNLSPGLRSGDSSSWRRRGWEQGQETAPGLFSGLFFGHASSGSFSLLTLLPALLELEAERPDKRPGDVSWPHSWKYCFSQQIFLWRYSLGNISPMMQECVSPCLLLTVLWGVLGGHSWASESQHQLQDWLCQSQI